MATGDGSLLWPEGCTSIQQVPHDLVAAYHHATYILKTSEALMEEEMPPDWMWAFPEELETHFERIKRERDKRFGGGGNSKDDPLPDGWVQNEYAKDLR